MKTYKFITIHSSENSTSPYTQGETLVNEYVKNGWEVEHVSPTGVKGELVITLSRNVSQSVQMLND